jgi:hypothetical protein
LSKTGRVFCSRECAAHYNAAQLPLNAQCLFCGRYFHRSPSERLCVNISETTLFENLG